MIARQERRQSPSRAMSSGHRRDPFAGSSLVPMLVIGLVLTFAGMIAALALS